MTYIPSSEIKQPQLHADTLGFTFVWKGHFLRGIYPNSIDLAKSYFDCGFIDEIVSKGLFPKTWISEYENEQFGLIIEHEMISPVLYATEWNFSMLKAAALMVLDIAQIGWKYGYNMVDCHKLNVMFKGIKPIYVDLGSFVPREDGCTGWHPYMNFMTSYYYILDIWKDGAVQIAKRMMAPGVTLNAFDYYLYKSPFCRVFPVFASRKISFINSLEYLASSSKDKIHLKSRKVSNPFNSMIISMGFWCVHKFRISPSQNLHRLQREIERMSIKDYGYKRGKQINIEEVEIAISRLGNLKSVTFIDSPTKEWLRVSKNIEQVISIQQDPFVSDAEYRYIMATEKRTITSVSFFLGNGAILLRNKYPESRLASDSVVVLGYKMPSGVFGLHNAMIFFDRCKKYSKNEELIVNIPSCGKEIRDVLLKSYFTDVVGDTFIWKQVN